MLGRSNNLNAVLINYGQFRYVYVSLDSLGSCPSGQSEELGLHFHSPFSVSLISIIHYDLRFVARERQYYSFFSMLSEDFILCGFPIFTWQKNSTNFDLSKHHSPWITSLLSSTTDVGLN